MTDDQYSQQGDVKQAAAQQAGEVKDHAAGQTADVKDHAVSSARDVAHTAGDEARSVGRDAREELRGLLDSSMEQLNTQAGTGQQRLAAEVRTLVDELGQMAQGSQSDGMATQFAREASQRGQRFADWLETHEPRDAVGEIRRFAARNPWGFLAIAAGAGLLAGRFARGLKDDDGVDPGRGYAADSRYRAATGEQYRPAIRQNYDPQSSGGRAISPPLGENPYAGQPQTASAASQSHPRGQQHQSRPQSHQRPPQAYTPAPQTAPRAAAAQDGRPPTHEADGAGLGQAPRPGDTRHPDPGAAR